MYLLRLSRIRSLRNKGLAQRQACVLYVHTYMYLFCHKLFAKIFLSPGDRARKEVTMALFGLVRGFAAFMPELVKARLCMCVKNCLSQNLGECQSPKSVSHRWQQKIASAPVLYLDVFYSLDLAAFGWRYSPFPNGGWLGGVRGSHLVCICDQFSFKSPEPGRILTQPMSYFSLGSNNERKFILRKNGG